MQQGCYGIVAKKMQGTKADDHYKIGVLVRITHRSEVASNVLQNYAEFGVEALQRFQINNVVMSPDDEVVKVCEVTMIDDDK